MLIECAWFDPLRTAATGRKTGLVTDARYRFERGVDPQSVLPGLDLATQMIHEALRRQAVEGEGRRQGAGHAHARSRSISAASRSSAGIKVPADEIKTILEALGCDARRQTAIRSR